MPPKKNSTKEVASGPKTPSDVLSKREIDLLCYSMLANPDNPTLSGAAQVALAKTAGFTNPKSLGNALRAIKQKLLQFQADSGAGAVNDVDGDGKQAGRGGKKRTTAKRARDVTEDGEEEVVKKVKSEDEGDVEA